MGQKTQFRVEWTDEDSGRRSADFSVWRSAVDFLGICRALRSCRDCRMTLIALPHPLP